MIVYYAPQLNSENVIFWNDVNVACTIKVGTNKSPHANSDKIIVSGVVVFVFSSFQRNEKKPNIERDREHIIISSVIFL